MFLLGKELAYDTMRDQTSRLSNALTKVSKDQAKRFASTVESDPRSGGPATYAATTATNVSHKICGTGSGEDGKAKATASTNCRSGAKGKDASDSQAEALVNGRKYDSACASTGCGIGSEDGTKALTAQQYDTLVKAFEADDTTVTEDKKTSVKAGNAFDGTASSSKIKTDVAGMCQQSRI